MKGFLTIISIFLSVYVGAQKPEKTVSVNDPANVTKYVLDNGLTVFLSENHDLPQVFGLVMTKAGGKNDPKDATGLAHYLEHMLFKGTETMGTLDYESEKPHLDSINDLYESLGKTIDLEQRLKIQEDINKVSLRAAEYAIPNEIDKILSEMGATGVNAFTSEEMTVYHNNFPANQMDKWLAVYAHRFEKPVFRLFQSELETVYEEKNRSNDNPGSKAFEVFLEKFYKNHPYGQQPLIGFTEHLKNPPLKRMYEYFNEYYVANNMCLILSGDFNKVELIEKIKVEFADWRTGEVRAFPKYEEQPFKGREHIEVKYTPIKMGIVGFRTTPNGSNDQAVVEVMNNLLTNSANSGLMDELTMNGDIMFGQVMPMNYNDHGATLMIFAPKLIGQKFEEAEQIIMDQIKRLREGGFTDEFLEATKQNMINDIKYQWEDNNSRALALAQAFSEGTEWSEYIKMESKINTITREMIIESANKYYADNYLILESGMGKAEQEKLDKPAFQAVVNKNEEKSEFYKYFSEIPSTEIEMKLIDFKNSISTLPLQQGVKIQSIKNPFNNLFEMSIRFGSGYYYDANIKYLAEYFNYIGTEDLTPSEFKQELFKLGSKIAFHATENEFVISVEGQEKNLSKTITLVEKILNHPEVDEDKLNKVRNDLKANKKFERKNPQSQAEILVEYAMYGENSMYLKDLTSKEIKKLTVMDLMTSFQSLKKHEVIIDFIGNNELFEVAAIVKGGLGLRDSSRFEAQLIPNRKMKMEQVVYHLESKDAVQSQLNFLMPMGNFDADESATIEGFNSYFGRNMSSLVFQEIREFRSLAYSAYGVINQGEKIGYENTFFGYIGCQADKTNDALSAMNTLIRTMPEKPERMEIIKASLINTTISSQPGFREMIYEIEAWEDLGFKSDPRKAQLAAYNTLEFDHITSYYKTNIQEKPMVITVVGNSKRFSTKELTQYGKVVKVKMKDITVN